MASKTIYPGMPSEANQQENTSSKMAGTIYPGMNSSSANSTTGESKPIMGFLFSVSKTKMGEYWPLYLGSNTIGRDSASSICLGEESVSKNHANIVVHKMKKQGSDDGIFVFVQDSGSEYGTLLNGNSLTFAPMECHNNDIITIGANYELLLILIDTQELGLTTKENFHATSTKNVAKVTEPSFPSNPVQHKGTLPGTFGQNPFGTQMQQPQQSNPSSNPFMAKKTTMYMSKK